jgi:diketogulonate reductase-like aldo/keto reductase
MSTIQENWKVDADGQVINEKGVVIAGNIRNINHSFLISKIPNLCRQVLHMQSQLELAAKALEKQYIDAALMHTNASTKERRELIEKITSITEVESLLGK